MHVLNNNETRSRNNFCRGKQRIIKYYNCVTACVSYPACNAHVPYYIVICGLSGSIILLHIISYTARFSRKNVNEHKMCVLIFSTTFV